MASRIHAHITLVQDVSDVALVVERLRAAAVLVARFRLTLGVAACWSAPAPEFGIYLSVHDVDSGIQHLREHLMQPPLAEPPGVEYAPHVTLLHPRTVDAARCRDAWELLREWHLDREVIIDTVTIVREDAHGWSAVERVLLG